MGNFKFGVSLRAVEGSAQWITKCRRAEELGYRAITVPDHLGERCPAPLPALAVAAAVTEHLRVGPLVMNVPFYNAALLARDVATTIQLTGDRFDLGLGAGHMKSEFVEAGLPWQRASMRIAILDKTITELNRRLVEDGTTPPPLLLAGNSDGVLELAAKHADIVGFAGLRQAPGQSPGTFQLDDAEAVDERVAFFRSRAGDREVEYNMLIQKVEITEDRRAAVEAWQDSIPRDILDTDRLLDAPQLLFGTVEEITAQLVARRERYGFSYISVFEPEMEKFAPVVRALAGT
ncbi:probable F420-dependent oxidoreductase, MSMEG_2516 family [Amycolatopsis xylanica]|uniref:Probable F420-dependent oxidoreductase, MSMEG_2516 family n=1 Tax=Amycolatopsis xylanica TaxID=589385 RepID=A0A1H3EP96_9PSEU|nr:TIGR03621 family F420-dependent LLM class oxidoreductase [Amycolatopsis xylanica]SDX80576.1 probable F420-dependent oxidoreductase, MSMEG_2516 family [Amycolatopsis xylanica]